MKNPYRITVLSAAAAVAAVLLAVPGHAQLPKDPEERAKVIAQIMQANSRQLTLFDREGKELSAMGPKDLYTQPVFSPDGKRVAVIKADVDKETNDLWIVDVATRPHADHYQRGVKARPPRPGLRMAPRWRTSHCARRFRALPKANERSRRRGTAVSKQRSVDSRGLVDRREVPDLLCYGSCRRRHIRLAGQCYGRAKAH